MTTKTKIWMMETKATSDIGDDGDSKQQRRRLLLIPKQKVKFKKPGMNPGFFFEIRDSYSLNNCPISPLTDKFAPFTAVSHFATFNFEMSGPSFAF